MTKLKSVSRTSIGDEVFKQFMEKITSGEWPPGEKIPSEDYLARVLSVSRVTIRAATQRLSALGLVKVKQGEGTFIEKYTASNHLNLLIPLLTLENKDIMQLMQLRKILEVGIIEVVARNISKPGIDTLENIYLKMVETKEDRGSFAEYDSQFHLTLADLSGNPLIVACYSVISGIFSSAMKQIANMMGSEEALRYHKKILDALKKGDEKMAQNLMQKHIELTIVAVSKVIDRQGDTADKFG